MRRAVILIAAALMLSACCGRNCPAEVAVIPQPQVVETGRSTVVLRAGEYDVVRSLDSTMRASSYSLDIDKKGIRICAGDAAGLFYAEQTLRQLVPADSAQVTLKRTHIEDWPEFGYRGMMLDVARHFFSVEDVKTVLDIMALHKLNYLHWHLTDDQGWRLEINAYPQLTKVGSMRRRTIIGKDPNGEYDENTPFDETPYGGFYTQDQVREIVEYAAERHITVIPEIEFPGHAVAALASYPWLSCTGEQYRVRETWECPDKMWQKCPSCAKRMKAEELETYRQLQGYGVKRLEKFLSEHGRSIIGWDEILEAGVESSAIVMSWRGAQSGIKAARSGNHVIMSPTDYSYFDYYQFDSTVVQPLAWGGYIPLEKVYSFDPYAGLEPEHRNISRRFRNWST